MQKLDSHKLLKNLKTHIDHGQNYSEGDVHLKTHPAKFSIRNLLAVSPRSSLACGNRRVNQLNEAFALRRAYAPRRQRRK